MRKWSKFYTKVSLWAKIKNVIGHSYLILNVLKYRPQRVLESGAGTGSLSFFISLFVKKIIGIDKDDVLVKRLKKSLKRKNLLIKHADVFDLPFCNAKFDVSFSQGLIEHFDDEDIKKIVEESLRVSKISVISVPNSLYNRRDFGNERLLTHKEWCDLFEKLGFKIIKAEPYWVPNRNIFSRNKTQSLIIVSR